MTTERTRSDWETGQLGSIAKKQARERARAAASWARILS